MSRMILAYPDYVLASPTFATVAFSGGNWLPALPLANLLLSDFAHVARSADTQLASTQFWIDLGVARDVRVAAVPRNNFSRNAQVRLRGCMTPDVSTVICDSGWQDVFPVIYPAGTLYWGHPSLWDGKISEEDIPLFPTPWEYVWSNPQIARYWLLEINDTANPAGYLDVPRVVLAPGWQPSVNMIYGAGLGIEDSSVAQQSLGGAMYYDQRTKNRRVPLEIDYLPEDEALSFANDMMQRLGISGQLYFIWDPDTPQHAQRRNFLARMRSLTQLQAVAWGYMNATYELVEVVA